MKRLLALDQASHTSGYAVFEGDKLVKHGKFTLNNEELSERLCHYRNEITKLIKENNIDKVAFEDIQLQESAFNNVVTYKILAEIFGVTEELLYELKIPYKIINSNTWKSKLDIKGKKREEQKKNAQLYVLNTYDVACDSDTADAICIGASTFIKKEREKKLTYHTW